MFAARNRLESSVCVWGGRSGTRGTHHLDRAHRSCSVNPPSASRMESEFFLRNHVLGGSGQKPLWPLGGVRAFWERAEVSLPPAVLQGTPRPSPRVCRDLGRTHRAFRRRSGPLLCRPGWCSALPSAQTPVLPFAEHSTQQVLRMSWPSLKATLWQRRMSARGPRKILELLKGKLHVGDLFGKASSSWML